MTASPPPFSDLVSTFARIGCLSFGGPAGQIALMHREVVEERGWVNEEQYLHALNFCHFLPGPEAQQLATWIGWKLHGWRGGLAAGLLFVIPGAVVILALSLLYAVAADLHWFAALFLGIKAAVLAIVLQALIRIAGRALGTWVTFAPCFLWIFAFAPWIERLEQAVKLKGALAAVTASVVGVIGSLTLWFAQHVLFIGGDLARIDWRAALLALLSAGLLFGLKWGVVRVLAVAALGGLALAQF